MTYNLPYARTSQKNYIYMVLPPKRAISLLGGISRQRELILTDLKSDRDSNAIIVVDFNTPLHQ